MIYSPKKSKIDVFLDERYAKIGERNKLLAIGLFAIVLIGAFYFLFFQPNQDEIASLAQKTTTANQELARVRKETQDLPRLKKELEEVRVQFETTSVLLPKSQEIPNLLRNISDLGRNSGLDFISFTPGQESPKDFYAEIPIDIKIRGPYHNLGLFLDKVSKLERIVTVNNIKTEKVDFDKNEILLSSSCKLITYRFTNTPIAPQNTKQGNKAK